MAAHRLEAFFIPRPMFKCKRNCLSQLPFNVVAVQPRKCGAGKQIVQAMPQFYSLLG